MKYNYKVGYTTYEEGEETILTNSKYYSELEFNNLVTHAYTIAHATVGKSRMQNLYPYVVEYLIQHYEFKRLDTINAIVWGWYDIMDKESWKEETKNDAIIQQLKSIF